MPEAQRSNRDGRHCLINALSALIRSARMAHARNPSAIVLMMAVVTTHLQADGLVCEARGRIVVFRLRTVVTTCLLTFIFLASSESCGRKSEVNYAMHFPFAYVQEDCGPADGLALQFYFTVKPSKCGKYDEPFLVIAIVENLPKSAPHDYTIGSGSKDVLVSRCQTHGHCEVATSGFLHLTKFDERKNASGEYEVHFRNGSVEKATFDATRCIVHFICG
jgi:hypothetical protein